MRSVIVLATLVMVALLAEPVSAAGPVPWQMGMQPAGTPVMAQLEGFHDLLLWVVFAITLLVLGLILYVVVRFNHHRNPEPSRRSHNTLLEITWTAVPVLLLVIIAIPSFKLLYFMDVIPETEMTVKATGRQWYWSYDYPDQGNFTFDANMVAEADLQPDQPRLLTTDNALVLPVGTNIRLLTTSSDVLHSWAMPSFGVKMDAIPGRLNDIWFRIDEPGMYFGQCSELCGLSHAFMPIMVRAVPKPEFEEWATKAREEYARADGVADEVDVAGVPAPSPASAR